MSVKKILMLGVVVAFIAPAMTSSLMASATKTMGQLALEQKQKQDAEILAAEQKRVAEEKKAQAVAVQAEHKQVVATENTGLTAKINAIITALNAEFGANVPLAKADDKKSLEDAIDSLDQGIIAMKKRGKMEGKVKGQMQTEITLKKDHANTLNTHLGNILPNHKALVGDVKDDLSNFVTVLTAADGFIGQIPAAVFTGVEVKGGAKVSLADYIEGMRKSLITVAGQSNAKKGAINHELNKYNLEIK